MIMEEGEKVGDMYDFIRKRMESMESIYLLWRNVDLQRCLLGLS